MRWTIYARVKLISVNGKNRYLYPEDNTMIEWDS